MLQRVQTLYLAVAFLLTGILPLFLNLWTTVAKVDIMAMDFLIYIALFGFSSLLALISIFSFKNRQNQFVINRLNMILNFILIGLLVYNSLTLSGEAKVSEKGIGMLLPIFSIVLLVLANKAIKKDEDLVKSVDRIR
ncbi:DUF4293 domain-containing protein [Flavobacterium sp.]|uniref:DUF4293 domain-containing protein n=1 Tax=Flavobacterium sp. TaxID=239 RepID=UPI0025C4BFF9|nr:DUF4293 domain-containing protein [Flavobacterium sp.]